MSNVLVLGAGWVGAAVGAAARHHDRVDSVTVIDPPFDPSLERRDAAATERLRALIADGDIAVVINACGRVQGDDDELTDANLHFVEWLCAALRGTEVRLVHIGSASEYGDPGTSTSLDESFPPAPIGP
jgi:nucleoside-diphosphate-sugar epimerase